MESGKKISAEVSSISLKNVDANRKVLLAFLLLFFSKLISSPYCLHKICYPATLKFSKTRVCSPLLLQWGKGF